MRIAVAGGLIAALAAGCKSSDNVPASCRAFVTTVDKLASCPKLAYARDLVKQQVDSMKAAFELLESVDGDALESQQQTMREACAKQDEAIRELYGRLAPECL